MAPAWARNSVNAVIIRQHSVTTHGDEQYTAFYNADRQMVLAKRKLGSERWGIRVTPYEGNAADVHNAISIAVDGEGFLHVSWDHHCHPLRYARSLEPGSLLLSEKLPMTGLDESRVTYPEFYNLDDGGLLFTYRDGVSGNGQTMVNRYDLKTRRWTVVQHPLIHGQGQRNAYTNQIAVSSDGVWHLAWNWRETGNVATNHDLCYARSADGGKTWTKSTGEVYALPITQDNAEVIQAIPQKRDLINHTTMAVDAEGRPMTATYWSPPGSNVPQYHLVWHDGRSWHTTQISHRTTPFRLSGGGTRRVLLSRPKLAVNRSGRIYMLFRDIERGDRVSVAICDDPTRQKWRFVDLTITSVAQWEPTYDQVLWKRDNLLHVFVERVGQGDGETLENVPPQMVSILEWKP